MKNIIHITLPILFLIITLISCSSQEENNFSIELLDGKPILAAHRCNAPLKVEEVAKEGIKNYEVDIHIENKGENSILMVGHEIESSTGQNIMDYMNHLSKINPNFRFLWFDFKDLDSYENEKIALRILSKLDRRYNIKKRVLVESQHPQFLTKLTEEGWHTSYYIPWDEFENTSEEHQVQIAKQILEEMTSYNITGISYDARAHEAIEKYFLNEKVNDKKIRLHTWDLSIAFGDSDFEKQIKKYNNTCVTLFSFPSENNI